MTRTTLACVAVLLFTAGARPSVADALVYWVPHEISTIAAGAEEVFVADLDGDGDLDVLSASYDDDKIAWYENLHGAGIFGPEQVITNQANGARSVFAADLDGDSDMDVVSGSANDGKIAWYENTDGLGTFGSEKVIVTGVLGTRGVFVADLDGDSHGDVITAGDFGLFDKLAWYRNTDGLGNFGPRQVIHLGGDGVIAVFAADVDGDSDQDVLGAAYNDDRVAWHENTDGLGSFVGSNVITTLTDSAYFVVAADVNGDSDIDVLSASYLDDKIAWYENTDGLGNFGAQQTITLQADGATAVYAADVDGDGDIDALSASYLDNTIAWYENTDGLGNFGPQQVITQDAQGAWGVVAADLDGDGDIDVISASADDNTIAWYENSDEPAPVYVPGLVPLSLAVLSSLLLALTYRQLSKSRVS